MRELEISSVLKQKEKLEISEEKQQEYKVVHESTIVPHENHTLFEINVNTLEVKKAEYASKVYLYNPFWKKGDKIPKAGEIVRREGMEYVSALNKKSAILKYNKGKNGTKLDPNSEYLKL